MSVHTRTRRTSDKLKKAVKPKAKIKKTHKKAESKEKSIPWREAFKGRIEKFTEPALMLRGYRHKSGMTQKEVADALSMNQHRISELECGKRAISKEMAQKFGDLFHTNYRRFL